MFSDEQREFLRRQLLEFLVVPSHHVVTLVEIDVAARIPRGLAPNAEAHHVIELVEVDGILAEQVVTTLRTLAGGVHGTDFDELLTVIAEWTPPGDAFSGLSVANDRPFIDREQLRDELRAAGNGTADRVVLINGMEDTGKSYAANFIEEEIRARPQEAAAVKLAATDNNADLFSAPQFAGSIVGSVQTAPHQQPFHEAPDRLAKLLAEWTANEIKRAGKTLWIVLDGFEHANLPSETSALVDELIRLHARDQRMACVRMVLCDFDPQRLNAYTSAFRAVSLHFPDTQEIEAYFEARFPDLNAGNRASVMNTITNRLPPDSSASGWMCRLEAVVKSSSDELKRQGF